MTRHNHLPYYRQETINARSGVHTPRSCVFRKSVTGHFGIVTGVFGNVTGDFGDVTGDFGDVTGDFGDVTAGLSAVS